MARPCTPPKSQAFTSTITFSDTTPVKRDISGSEVHTSTLPKKASDRYADMTFDICEKFIGPMPVSIFFEEFIREAPTPRPQDPFTFLKASVSQNEDEFAGLPDSIDVQ